MAWKDTLLDASFKGVTFEVSHVSRANRRAIAVHEYPYVGGAELEDLSIGPRQVRLQAVFYGDDYESRLAQLIAALEDPGSGYLVHPIHGNMLVMAESWDDGHEAETEGAVLEISFIEHQTRNLVFSAEAASSKTDALASGASSARAAADDALADHVAKIKPSEWKRITVLKDVFNQAKSKLKSLLSVTSSVKAVLSDLDPLLYPRAYAADLMAVVDQAFQGLPFGGRNLLYSSDRSASSSSSTNSSSSSAEDSAATGSGLDDFETVRRTLDPADIALVPAVAVPDATMLADTAVVQAHLQVYAATVIAEAAAIVLAGELEDSLTQRSDLEGISGQTRAGLQVAIDSAQGTLDTVDRASVSQTLRDLAYQTQEATRAVINQRPPLVRRAAPIGGPVRLVAHALHGDGERASEIVRLNSLGRKLFVTADEVLNVYAR